MRRSRFMLPLGFAVAACALVTGRAEAVDGVVEINEARAMAGGVSSVDTPGYPVSLNAEGSYRLTGNLTVGADTAAIQIIASQNVTIDLNGFTIQGPTSCTGIPVTSCQPSGSSAGIDGSARQSVTIRNGIVRGFPNNGVIVGPRANIDGVVVSSNGGSGLQFGNGSVVRACRASQNGADGFAGAVGVVIESSTADANGQYGIRTSTNSVVTNCTTASNGTDGIVVFEGSSVRSSSARANHNNGISTSGACLVTGCTASENTSVGLLLGTGSGYVQNVLVENNGGPPNSQVNGGTDLGANICVGGANGNACP